MNADANERHGTEAPSENHISYGIVRFYRAGTCRTPENRGNDLYIRYRGRMMRLHVHPAIFVSVDDGLGTVLIDSMIYAIAINVGL